MTVVDDGDAKEYAWSMRRHTNTIAIRTNIMMMLLDKQLCFAAGCLRRRNSKAKQKGYEERILLSIPESRYRLQYQ